MKHNIKIRYMIFWSIVLSIFVFVMGVHADEKTVTISEIDFIEYINIVQKYNQLKDVKQLSEDQKEAITKLKEQIDTYKKNEIINDRTIADYEKMNAIRDTLDIYKEKLIESQRDNILQLETKGAKDRVGKVSRIAENTATGCIAGLAFMAVGAPVGCAMGFISGLAKDFFYNF